MMYVKRDYVVIIKLWNICFLPFPGYQHFHISYPLHGLILQSSNNEFCSFLISFITILKYITLKVKISLRTFYKRKNVYLFSIKKQLNAHESWTHGAVVSFLKLVDNFQWTPWAFMCFCQVIYEILPHKQLETWMNFWR